MSDRHEQRLDELAARLDRVAADLDEVMFDRLREAASIGQARPTDDKRLTQARRAVEKAVRLLRGGGVLED